MELLIIALVVAKFVERGVIDAYSMSTGKTPPSHEYRMAKLAKEGVTTDPKSRGPLRQMISGWWADAVEDVDEMRRDHRRETKEEKTKARRQRQEDRQKTIDGAKEILVEKTPEIDPGTSPEPRKAGKPEEPSPEPEWGKEKVDDPEHSPAETNEDLEDTAVDIPAVTDEVPGYNTPKPWVPPAFWDPEPEANPADDTVTDPSPVVENPADDTVTDLPPVTVPASDRDLSTEWRPINQDAVIYAFPNKIKTEPEILPEMERNDMSDAQNATEGGLGPHIRWTLKMSIAQTKAIGNVEMVQSQMNRGGVGGKTQGIVSHLGDLHRQISEGYKTLAALLVEQQKVAEAYAATGNEAGDKSYVTTE